MTHNVSKDIPVTDLMDIMSYDPQSGILTWNVRPQRFFTSKRDADAWNTRYSGRRAITSIHTCGYNRGTIFDKQYYAHRIAWALYYGYWPEQGVDHINCIKSDNRIENLRLATTSQNGMNRGKMKRNKSGCKGVSWNNKRQKWEAQISSNKKKIALGMFSDPQSAHEAYIFAMKDVHLEFGRPE